MGGWRKWLLRLKYNRVKGVVNAINLQLGNFYLDRSTLNLLLKKINKHSPLVSHVTSIKFALQFY